MSTPLVHVVIPLRVYAEAKKQRPYTDRRTGQPKMGKRIDKPRQAEWKKAAAIYMKQAMRAAGYTEPFGCALRVMFTKRRPRPGKPGNEVPDLRFDTGRPDVDNFEKIAGDAGSGIIWEDDRFIVENHGRKEFGTEWELEITVWEALP
jgi:Holliday junction resolvase RusA-like endonuclease